MNNILIYYHNLSHITTIQIEKGIEKLAAAGAKGGFGRGRSVLFPLVISKNGPPPMSLLCMLAKAHSVLQSADSYGQF